MFEIEKYVQKVKIDESTFAYFLNVTEINVESDINILPKVRKEKVMKCRSEKEQKLVIGAYLLLLFGLKDNDLNADKFEFGYEKNGKPILKNCPLFFSISHSEDYAAIVLSKNAIGIDVQKAKEFKPEVLKYIATEQDLLLYNNASDKKDAFYKIWCGKEAYSKMIGTGLNKETKSINISSINVTYLNIIPNYYIAISK